MFSYFGIGDCKKKKNLPESVLQSTRLVSLSSHGKRFHQEFKANGEGSFDGEVQRMARAAGWERQAGSQESTSHTTQNELKESFGCRAQARGDTWNFGQLCSGKQDFVFVPCH